MHVQSEYYNTGCFLYIPYNKLCRQNIFLCSGSELADIKEAAAVDFLG